MRWIAVVFVAILSSTCQAGRFAFPFNCENDDDWTRWLCGKVSWTFDYGDRDNKPWWKGDNICVRQVERNETDDDLSRFSTSTSTECTDEYYISKTTVVRNGTKYLSQTIRECCHGYARKPGQRCKKIRNMKDILPTMVEIGSGKVAASMNITGLADDIKNKNFTVLAPTDEAMEDFLKEEQGYLMPSRNVLIIDGYASDVVTSKTSDVLKAHVLPGYYRSYDLEDKGKVETLSPSTKIRFTTARKANGEKMELANCVEIVQKNRQATDGIVHQINKVLKATDRTVAQYISSNPEFSQLKTVVGRIGIHNLLPEGSEITMFLPTNAAFEKLDPEILKSDDRLTALLKHHMVPQVICSATVRGHHGVKSMAGETLWLKRTRDDKLFIGDAQITSSDIMAADGVVHVVDDLLVPHQVKSVMEFVTTCSSTALELIEKAGLVEDVKKLTNFTMFLPTNQAFKRYFRGHDPADRENLRDLLLYHIATPMVTNDEWSHVTSLKTLLQPHSINVRRQGHFRHFRLQCDVSLPDPRRFVTPVYGGRIHFISEVLTPPTQTIVDRIMAHDRLQTFAGLLKKSPGVLEKLRNEGRFTVFAPFDAAFDALSYRFVEDLRSNASRLEAFIKRHIVEDYLCLGHGSRGNYHSLAGSSIRVRSHFFKPSVSWSNGNSRGHSDILVSNIQASNGLLNIIEKAMTKQSGRNFFHMFDMDDFDDFDWPGFAWD